MAVLEERFNVNGTGRSPSPHIDSPQWLFKMLARQSIILSMVGLLSQHLDEISALCRKFGVQKLELFGSAARDDFDPTRSDVDFFFEFDDNLLSLSDRFFGLMEDLEKLFGCKVDLVSSRDVRNLYFLQVANEHRVTLYAA